MDYYSTDIICFNFYLEFLWKALKTRLAEGEAATFAP